MQGRHNLLILQWQKSQICINVDVYSAQHRTSVEWIISLQITRIYIYIYAERETDSRLDPFVECFRCKITRILVCSPQSIEPCKQMTIIVFKKCMMDVMIGWCTKPDTVED